MEFKDIITLPLPTRRHLQLLPHRLLLPNHLPSFSPPQSLKHLKRARNCLF